MTLTVNAVNVVPWAECRVLRAEHDAQAKAVQPTKSLEMRQERNEKECACTHGSFRTYAG